MNRLLIGLALVALLLVGCSSDGTEPTAEDEGGAAETEVEIDGFAFSPDSLTVSVGTTVTWNNIHTGIPHTSTSDDGAWSSGTLQPGDGFSFTFEEPGEFPYICTIHPFMEGTIVVVG